MSSEKTLSIVIRVVEFSESSCVVTLFTQDFGKISALAKGARRPKSPFEAALDLLAVCRVVFLRKSSDALDLLTEAKLERRFRSATRDLSRLYAGYYVAELLRDLTENGDPHPDLFQAADDTLARLDAEGDVAAEVLRFELTALRELGHLPSLDACVGCGEVVTTTGRIAFGLLSGGVMCSRCRVGKRQVVSVSAGAIHAMQQYAEADGEAWRKLEIDPRLNGELRGLLNNYLKHLLGHRPKMHDFIGALA